LKGAYLLIIGVNRDSRIKVGSLGLINFKKGIYVYVGSAMGGLEQRISRHLRSNKKTFWHIDYLLKNRNAKIIKVFYKESNEKEECKIARRISKFGEPVMNFGSSDCKCESHLFRIKNPRVLDSLNFSEYDKNKY